MGPNPLVSIVTPTYNSERFLEDNLQSIINQSYDNIEHIVIDGESNDNTIDILSDYEETYNMDWISEPDDGMYDAIEKGFEKASGEIFSWLNSDDKYFPWSVEVAVEHLKKEGVEWITGHPTRWDNDGKLVYLNPLRPYYRQRWLKEGWYHGDALGWIQQESMFWTAELWEQRGGFPDGIKMAGDYYLWKEFAKESEIVQIGTAIGGFRRHSSQLTSDMDKYYDEVPKMGIYPRLLGRLRINNFYSLLLNFRDII